MKQAKKFIFGITLIVILTAVSACEGREIVKKVIVHDTIYRDSFLVTVKDTVFYDTKWLRKKFEKAPRACWKNYKYGYMVEYPEFMKKVWPYKTEGDLLVEYHGVRLIVNTYEDKYDMSVEEKYKGLNMAAVTKSISNNSFLMAGAIDKNKFFMEKDIKLKELTWMYIRVEFPPEMAWAVDPLLHYVKDFQPFFFARKACERLVD